MPHWLLKSAAQRAISWLPASHKWNELFQRHVTGSLALTADRFEQRVDYCRRHLDHFHEARPNRTEGFTALELGTGWYPVVPVGLYLCGAAEVWTFDISPLLNAPRLKETLARFVGYEQNGALKKLLPRVRAERLAGLRELAAGAVEFPPEIALEKLKIHVLVRDAQGTGLPAGTVDLFASTGVLEYIPREVLRNILIEFKRIGSSDAVQSHYLNLIDQYWYFDKSITPFNFLRYSTAQWKIYNSPLTWQSRLRISDFRQLFSETGSAVIKEHNTPGSPADLQRIQLAPEFAHYKPEDLLVLYAWLVTEPTSAPLPAPVGKPLDMR